MQEILIIQSSNIKLASQTSKYVNIKTNWEVIITKCKYNIT